MGAQKYFAYGRMHGNLATTLHKESCKEEYSKKLEIHTPGFK